MQPNQPHPWPLPHPAPSQARSRSDSRHPNAQALMQSPQTHRGSGRCELPVGPPAPRPSQVPRRANMMAVSDLPPVPMSPPIRLPTSVPLMSQNAEASSIVQVPSSAPTMPVNPSYQTQAILQVPPPSNFAIVQAHAN